MADIGVIGKYPLIIHTTIKTDKYHKHPFQCDSHEEIEKQFEDQSQRCTVEVFF